MNERDTNALAMARALTLIAEDMRYNPQEEEAEKVAGELSFGDAIRMAALYVRVLMKKI